MPTHGSSRHFHFSFTDLLFIRLLSFDSVCGQITSQQEVAPDRKVGDVKVRRGSRCGVKAMSVIHNQRSVCVRVQSRSEAGDESFKSGRCVFYDLIKRLVKVYA